MPNWCVCNLAVRGEQKELKAFTDLLNSLPERTAPSENDFGPFWMGTLADALGGDWRTGPFRGVVCPDPQVSACWTCTEPEIVPFEICPDGILRMSTCSAWSIPYGFFDLIKSKYPSLEFFFKATDEFGNFHVVDDPDCLVDDVRFELGGLDCYRTYKEDKKAAFIKDLQEVLVKPFPVKDDQPLDEAFVDQCYKFWEQNHGEDEITPEIIVWTQRKRNV